MPSFQQLFHRRKKTQTPSDVRKVQQPVLKPLNEQRAYLADTPYLLPKDALEDQRLNFQHHLLYRTISNHYLAPLAPTTASILDVGTGTGIWPIEMATLFPHAHVLGVDVALSSLPRPLPLNCLFSQANILQGLPFPDQQFEFTH